MHYRRIERVVIPVLMLVLLLTSMTVSAFHNHRDCENLNNCAICNFHVSSSVLSLDNSPDTNSFDDPVLLSAAPFPERVSGPFHTAVFSSHAPPQFS